jgi:hypothetical protein
LGVIELNKQQFFVPNSTAFMPTVFCSFSFPLCVRLCFYAHGFLLLSFSSMCMFAGDFCIQNDEIVRFCQVVFCAAFFD